MTQRMITIITQGDSVVIEFKELERHQFIEKYHIIGETNETASYGKVMQDWCEGKEIEDHPELRVSEEQ